MDKSGIRALKRHRHLIAAMIEESLGYFTPLMAANALRAHREGRPCFCEWYIDMAEKRHRWNGEEKSGDAAYLSINRDVIRRSFLRRHKSGYQRTLPIVDRNIAGNESVGASWF